MFKLEIKLPLNKTNVEKALSDKGYNAYDLAKHYITGFPNFNVKFRSSLREDDTKDSMIVIIRNNKIVISDFGYKTGLTIYDYLVEKFFSNKADGFMYALNLIKQDFQLNTICSYKSHNAKKIFLPKQYNNYVRSCDLPVKIEVKRTRINENLIWSKADINYWNQYGIPISKLEEKGIAPLSKFWITNFNKDGIKKEYNVQNELCYVYPFFRNEAGFYMYKIYLPFGYKGNKDMKWISNVNKKVVQNLKFIPKSGDLLIVQSSYKDAILMELLLEILNVVAPNGEGIWFDEEMWNVLKKNWKRIVIFGNNDFDKKGNPGLNMARRHSLKHNVPFVCTPDDTASDISDYYKKFGRFQTEQFLKQILEYINLIT